MNSDPLADAERAAKLSLWAATFSVAATFAGPLPRSLVAALVVMIFNVGFGLSIQVAARRQSSASLQYLAKVYNGVSFFVLGGVLLACILFKPGYR